MANANGHGGRRENTGGRRNGSGRKAGVPNKITAEMREEALKLGKSPLEFLVEVMLDKKRDWVLRVEAAKAAARYMHSPMPIAITHQGNPNQPIQHKHRMIHEMKQPTTLEASKAYEESVKTFKLIKGGA